MSAIRNALPLSICWATMALTIGCGSDEQTTDPVELDAGFATVDAGQPDSGEVVVDCSTRPTEAPLLRSEASLVYDASNERLIMYGGNIAEVMCPMFSRTPSDDVWAFELDCNNWRRLSPAGTSPGARVRHAATVDTTRNRMIIFGGRQGTGSPYRFLNDTWAFDFTNDTWTEISVTGGLPSLRDDTVMAYDAVQDRVVIFGGDGDNSGFLSGARDDLWSLNLGTGTWTQLTPAGPRPQARLLHGAANLGNRMVVFGGAEDFIVYRNDLWIFDFMLNTWSQVQSSNGISPRNRFGPAVFADRAQRRAIVFAGHDDAALGNSNDTWGVFVDNGAWAQVSAGDTPNPNAGPSSQCNFPPDFTFVDLTVPDRRSAFPYTQSDTHAYVFGGNTDCGRANDIWSFEFATNTWTELFAANGGISCPHSGQQNCVNLCF